MISFLILIPIFFTFYFYRKIGSDKIYHGSFLVFLYTTIFAYSGILYAHTFEEIGIYLSPKTKLLVLLGYIFFSLGMILPLIKTKLISVNDIVLIYNSPKRSRQIYILIYIIGGLISFIYSYVTGYSGLLSSNIDEDRMILSGGYGFLKILSISCLTFGFTMFYMHTKSKIKSYLLFTMASVLLLNFGHRRPFLVLSLITFLISLKKNKTKLSLIKLSIFGGGLFLMVVVLGAIRKNTEDIFLTSIARFGWRPFVTIWNFDRILEIFSSKASQYGYTIFRDFTVLLPGKQLNTINWLSQYIGTNDNISITATLSGIGYLDFKEVGIVIYNLFAGISISLLFTRLINSRFISSKRYVYNLLLITSIWGVGTVGLVNPILFNVIPFTILYFFSNAFIKR